MRKQEHRYEIYETKKGFKVVPIENNRPIIHCYVDSLGSWNFKEGKIVHKTYIPLYNFYNILNKTIELLYRSWTPKANNSKGNKIKEDIIIRYCKTATSKTLARKIRDIWRTKVNTFDPKIEELYRKLYSVSNGSGEWRRIRFILQHKSKYKYLINDLLKYPAARMAVLHDNSISDEWSGAITDFPHDWMHIYAKDGEVYTSLTKTLMHLPSGLPFYRLFHLSNMRLPEPATTKYRLWAYAYISASYMTDQRRNEFAHIIVKSTDEQIKEAIKYIWKYFPTEYTGDFRKRNGVEHSFRMIFDYDGELGDWDIMGLTKRAEKYHHDEEMRLRLQQERWEAERRIRQEEWEREHQKIIHSKTALPPIPLPDNEYIKFLDDYGMVEQEGKDMGHCIAMYAERAVKGNCYLFHVDYSGQKASVEVSTDGYVRQSYGPHDRTNDASKYGERILGEWAKGLRNNNKQPKIRIEQEENERFEFVNRIGARQFAPALLENIPF